MTGSRLVCGILAASALVYTVAGGGCSRRVASTDSIRITFATSDPGEGVRNLQKRLRQFEAKHPNIRVKLQSIPSGGYATKMMMMFASGTAPDVFTVNDSALAHSLATKGIIRPLDDLIAGDREFKKEAFFENSLSLCTFGGKLYGLLRSGEPCILFYNRDLFDKAGLRYPDESWTWDDYHEAAKRLTADTNGDGRAEVYGSWGLITPDMLFMMARQQGGDLFDESGRPTLETPEVIGSLEFIEKLYREGISPRPDATADTFQHELFAAGKLGLMPHFPYMIRWLNDNMTGRKYDIAPLPAFSPERRVVESYCSLYAISSKTRHSGEAWQLVKFLGGDEGQQAVALGKGVPTIKSIAYSKEFGPPPPGIRVAVDALAYSVPYPHFTGARESMEFIQRELDLVVLGKKSARTALRDAQANITRWRAKWSARSVD